MFKMILLDQFMANLTIIYMDSLAFKIWYLVKENVRTIRIVYRRRGLCVDLDLTKAIGPWIIQAPQHSPTSVRMHAVPVLRQEFIPVLLHNRLLALHRELHVQVLRPALQPAGFCADAAAREELAFFMMVRPRIPDFNEEPRTNSMASRRRTRSHPRKAEAPGPERRGGAVHAQSTLPE